MKQALNTIPTREFEPALERFMYGARAIIREYYTSNSLTVPELVLEAPGARYYRVVSTGPGDSRSAWAFIDRTTGDVLKPAGWSKPAKHARGNIFDDRKGLGAIGPYGPAYLR